MPRLRVAVINGPNLNLLGQREPAIYGRATLADVEVRLREVAAELDAYIAFSQFNGEGDIIDAIHAMYGAVQGIIINAGAYAHSSLAIRDALAGVRIPFIEVHVSNVHAREPERRHLILASCAVGVICGLGVYGYEAAVRGIINILRAP